MAKDSSMVTQAHRGNRQQVWSAVKRRGAGRKPVDGDGVTIGTVSPLRARAEPTSLLKTLRARPLGRTLALWIIVGALWVSLGMIVLQPSAFQRFEGTGDTATAIPLKPEEEFAVAAYKFTMVQKQVLATANLVANSPESIITMLPF